MNKYSATNKSFLSVVQITLVIFFFFFLFTQHYEATKGDEILVYKRAQILFEEHRNPYERSNMIGLLPPGSGLKRSLMVWNPPLLFVLGKVFLSPSIEILQRYWFYLSTLLAFGAVITVVFTLTSESITLYLISGLAMLFISVPYAVDISIGQLGSLLSFIAVTGSLLFIKKYYRTSGIVLSTLAVKPHIFALLIFSLMLISLKNKKRAFIYYFFGSVVILSALAELCYPGIWALWIYREEWPRAIYGATLGSLLTNSFKVSPLYKHVLSILPLTLLLSYFSKIILTTDLSSVQRLSRIIFLALMVTALVAPYGFIFDHQSTTCSILFFMLLDKKKTISCTLISVAVLTYLATVLLIQVFDGNLFLIFLSQLIQPISYFYLALLGSSTIPAKQNQAQSI